MSAEKEWHPLLEGGDAQAAHGAVHRLARLLSELPADQASAPEKAMRALLFAYCDEAFPNQGYDDEAGRFLEAAIEGANATPLSRALHGGLLTIGWAMDHIAGDEENEDGVELDQALLDSLSAQDSSAEYDIISGTVGIGVYAIERLPRPSALALLAKVLDQLEARALRVGSGLSWHTAPEALPPAQRAHNAEGYFNAGLAHGVPGIAALCSMALRVGVESERAARLLRGSLEWMEGLRLSDQDALYPSWVSGGASCSAPSCAGESSRTAWCYGDPGVAIAYWGAGQATEQSSWSQHAVDLLCKSLRRSAASAHIRDAGLCHGAAGYAHILNRVGQASGEEALREAARRWYRRTLHFARPGEGLAGYKTLVSPPSHRPARWEDDPTFLTGISGIALALLAASTSIAPNWDRILGIGWP